MVKLEILPSSAVRPVFPEAYKISHLPYRSLDRALVFTRPNDLACAHVQSLLYRGQQLQCRGRFCGYSQATAIACTRRGPDLHSPMLADLQLDKVHAAKNRSSNVPVTKQWECFTNDRTAFAMAWLADSLGPPKRLAVLRNSSTSLPPCGAAGALLPNRALTCTEDLRDGCGFKARCGGSDRARVAQGGGIMAKSMVCTACQPVGACDLHPHYQHSILVR